MGDTCSICGGYTECVIGSYYQCRKCESAAPNVVKWSIASRLETVKVYYGKAQVKDDPRWDGFELYLKVPDNGSGLWYFDTSPASSRFYFEIPVTGVGTANARMVQAGTKIISWGECPK